MTDAPRTEYRQHRFSRPPGATELLIVRHGESEPAIPGVDFPLVDGHGDPGLAPDGLVQAEQVGARLADQQVDAIYVTILRRTAQTAAPLAARTGLVPVVVADLAEVKLGEWEGGSFRQHVAEGHPIAQEMWRQERWDVIPGAESQEAFATRVRRGFEGIVAAHPDQRVAVFVHGGVIGELLHQVTESGRRWAFIGSDNGAISHVVAQGSRWILRRFNDTTHMQPGFDVETPTAAPGSTGTSA